MANELRRLRIEYNLKSADIIAAAKTVCPSFDKAMLSKCENSDKYGVSIKPEIMRAIIDICVPEHAETIIRRINGGNYLPRRVSCRLEESVYAELQQRMSADGYDTMQELLTDLIKEYIV